MCLLREQKQKPCVISEVRVLKTATQDHPEVKHVLRLHIPCSHMKCSDTYHLAWPQGVFQKTKEGSVQRGSPNPTSRGCWLHFSLELSLNAEIIAREAGIHALQKPRSHPACS